MDDLLQFNQQVLQCQDDAFTLAWYLLGDDAQAEAVTQAAVEAAFPLAQASRPNCRLLFFEQVLRRCAGKYPITAPLGVPQSHAALFHMPAAERQAIILIEILNLGYPETARLLHCSVKDVSHRLAQARRRLVQMERA